MGDIWWQLLLIIALVAINAALAGTEMALISLREVQLDRLERRSATGAVLARLGRQPNRFLATIQIGITVAGFLASAVAAVSLAEPLQRALGVEGSGIGAAMVVLITLVLSFVTLVFGELAPKRLAMQRAERWALVMARPLDALSRLARPFVWLLSVSTNAVVRLFRGDPNIHRETVTGEELRDMLAIHETFSPEQRRILGAAFEIAERRVDRIMVPRQEMFMLDAEQPCDTALLALRESGHSQAPVAIGRNPEQIIGVTHLRDLVGSHEPTAAVARPVLRFPESALLFTVLRQLQVNRTKFALVVNEYGGTAGLVTVEDVLEELVGEIYDETDADLAAIIRPDDSTILMPGGFPVHDLLELGIELPTGNYATIAGLILDHLGRFPQPGERLAFEDRIIEIRRIQGHRISEVAIIDSRKQR